MIIYGSKSKLLATEVTIEKCDNCGKQDSLQLSIFQKYAHVFWIPFFPIGKTGGSQCQHCKQVLKSKELPQSAKLAYDNLKRQSKTPLWMFSGIVLLGFLILFGSYQSKQNDKKNLSLISSPRSGDIFEIRTQEGQYTLYRVQDVFADSVHIRVNQYETNKPSGLADLKRKGEAVYSEALFVFLKSDLKEMLEKGEIIDIDRHAR